jgi:hypothetical protein
MTFFYSAPPISQTAVGSRLREDLMLCNNKEFAAGEIPPPP